MLPTQALVTILAALATTVHGHGAMVAVTGANGITATGMGINPATPRDGTRRNPFQQDTSIIRDGEIADGEAGPCGRTLAGGVNDVAAAVGAAAATGLPSMTANGQIAMTIHQVNGDGAGPYTCAMSTDATGTNFVPMTIVTNVPGENSRSRARATPFPLVAQAPPGTTCTGGPNGDACIVRCRNDARAGPFGGCAVVTNATPPTPPVGNATLTPQPATAQPPVAQPVASEPVGAPVAQPVVSGPVGAPVAQPVVPEPVGAPVAQPVVSEPVGAPVAQPVVSEPVVAPVAQTAAQPQAAVGAAEADEEDKRSLFESIKNLFAKRDYSRRRMVNSRIVDVRKRGQWI